MTDALITYLGLLLLAALEASPFGYLIPGTLGVLAAGSLVQVGKLNGPATLIAVWIGVIAGDLISYGLAVKCGGFLRRRDSVAAVLARANARLQRHPIAFVFLSHLSPFLKNAVAPAAGLAGMPLSRFLSLEIAAALLDAFWFLSLGFVFSATVGSVSDAPAVARVVGTVAILAVAAFIIGRGRKCALPRKDPPTLLRAKRGFGFILMTYVLVVGWEIVGRVKKRLGAFDRPDYRAALNLVVDLALPGDIVLVGRADEDAPWGMYSHVMLVVMTPFGKALMHAFEANVQLTPPRLAPMCGKIALLRVECTEAQRGALIEAAWSALGTPFKLGIRKPSSSLPQALNCIGLIEWAAAQVQLDLTGVKAGGIVVPDDLLSSALTQVVFAWREGDPLERQNHS